MQIVVNTRLLLPNKLDGIGWFTYQTLKRITQQHPDVHFVFLFDRPYDNQFIFADNITPLIIGPQARHAFLFYAWFQFSVKSILNKLKPDLFLSPDGMLSLGAKCKQLPVIHDINFLHHPKDVPFWASKFYNRYFPKYAHEASRIATVSEYSKQDISKSYGINSGKIDVVYNGINETFSPLNEEQKIATKKKYTNNQPYFVFVGSLHPRKNVKRLLQAFDAFKSETNADFKLVLAGANFWGMNELKETLEVMKFAKDVVFTGRVNDEELNSILASAFALTFIPYFEGFGIPMIEAMQCEVPVIASNTTCLPEIAEDAALFVNPFDVNEIKNAMIYIYQDTEYRKRLIEKGNKRKTLYSWDKSANLLWDCILKTV